jgi:hypothetical protein
VRLHPATTRFLTARRHRAALRFLIVLALAAGAAPAQADSVRGLGPRFGIGTDPDQLILGLHIDAGRLAPHARFQPDVEFGLGDNHTLVVANLPVHYVFPTRGDVRPYLGGGFALGLENRDRNHGRSDSDLEAAFLLIGGLEWPTARSRSFFVELNIVAGDLHDFEFVGGFTFR